jgi:hypothetical protein
MPGILQQIHRKTRCFCMSPSLLLTARYNQTQCTLKNVAISLIFGAVSFAVW